MRGYLLTFLAQASWLRGERPRAEALARDAAACKHTIDDRLGLNVVLGTLAWMAAERGQHERAAILLGCSQRVRASLRSAASLAPFWLRAPSGRIMCLRKRRCRRVSSRPGPMPDAWVLIFISPTPRNGGARCTIGNSMR